MAGAKPEKDYIAEYSKSGRSTCKICRKNIAKDSLRIGHYIQSARFDGWVPNWHHAHCFLGRKKEPITSPHDIEGFVDLKFQDQEKIKHLVEQSEPLTAAEASKATGPLAGGPAEGFEIEYAKSARAVCRHCQKVIEKDEIRLGPMGRMDHRPYLPVPEWHHLDCFFEAGNWSVTPADLDGFENLNKEDQMALEQRLQRTSSNKKDAAPPAVSKAETTDSAEAGGNGRKSTRKHSRDASEPQSVKRPKRGEKVHQDDEEHRKNIPKTLTPKEEKEIKEHSDKLFAIRKQLHNVSRTAMKHVLEANGQHSQGGEAVLQSRLADIMLHGAPEACPRCKGSVKYEDGHYKCTGLIDEYTKCMFHTPSMKRRPFKVPKDVEDDYLKHFKFVKKPIPKALEKLEQEAESYVAEKTKHLSESASGAASPLGGAKGRDASELPRPFNPLRHLVFALHDNKGHPLDHDALKHKIHGAGGLTMTKVSKRVTHVLTTRAAYEAGGAAIAAAARRNLPVVTEEFIDACIAAGAPVSEEPYLLAGEVPPEKEESSVPKNAVAVEKAEGGVDVETGIADDFHVYSKGDDVYSVVLNHTDLAAGLNSFYVMQVIQSDSRKKTYLWRKWGRIGTDIKNHKLEDMPLHDCVEEFKKLFEEKTGSKWGPHAPEEFEQVQGKYSVAETGLGLDSLDLETAHASLVSTAGSTLPPSVASLVHLIFDSKLMHKAMEDMNIDVTKLPLGELSSARIHKGYSVLCDIQAILEDENFGPGGVTESQVIDTHEKLMKNTELVESLLQLEKMVSMERAMETEMEKHLATEKYYENLRTPMRHIQRHEPVFHIINTYLKNTQEEESESSYGLELVDAFEIEPEHEKSRSKKFADVKERLLLWHGSRMTNWASILSEGLRIAPPEAPTAGYSFGKGLYFSDMSRRSASACFPSRNVSEGLMLLSEVVLGETLEVSESRDHTLPTRLPEGVMSVKARGRRFPDPEDVQNLPDGLVVSCGRGKDASGKDQGQLHFNEYVVYDRDQALSRFLVRVRFDFGSA